MALPRLFAAAWIAVSRWLAPAVYFLVGLGMAVQSAELSANEPAAPGVDFVRDIQPIFAEHCAACHGAKRQEGGLRLTDRASALAGGDSGQKAIVPSDAKASRLIRVLDGSDTETRMPPEGEGKPLSAEQIALLTRWINEGAAWPATGDQAPVAAQHWAWRPPVKAPLPSVKQTGWPRQPFDYFVLQQIERAGLSPAAEADRYTLARRVHLDLIGLPPTPEQLAAFINDPSPDAYERMVDRVLAEPAYGERWARVWLDLARYADSKGYGSDPLRTIWRYRDWVIEAFNRNQPYDQFTIEQLAGDLLPRPTPDQLLATAFHRNTMANDEGGTDDEEFRVAAVKDRIETTIQVWMGLTMGCAKCHSHKFDPITQREYYAAYAFFDQTEDADRGDEEPRLPTPTRIELQEQASLRDRLAALQQQLDTPPPGLDEQLAAWESQLRERDRHWTVAAPQRAVSEGGTHLRVLADQSVLAVGDVKPDLEVYRLDVPTDAKRVTAIRLETLHDDALPGKGPGRADGHFVINEVAVTVKPSTSSAPRARYLRIEIPGEKKILSLAEVQIFSGNENIASRGKATQSSTWFNGPAELAIDQNTNGDFEQKSVTHTGEEANPWWEIDFGKETPLDRVVLWNRTGPGLEERLKGFRITLLDEGRHPLWQRADQQAPKPSLELDLKAPTDVELVSAASDFDQEGWPAAKAIDGNRDAKSGWAIGPQSGVDHAIVLRLRTPLDLREPSTLGITLVQSYGQQHTLGRFRLALTDQDPPADPLPRDVALALDAARELRTAEQQLTLRNYFWRQSPSGEALRQQIAATKARLAEIEKQISATPVMRELPADKRRTTHVMIKGNFRSLGDAVEPAVPAAFHPLSEGRRDRLALAQWLVDPANPLTARVAVNRLWAQLFGVGIVATEEDFGTQGLPPTHPELLDWLAVSFREGGWDLKDVLRQMVTSATYRQSSSPTAEVLARDPANRLLARGPRFRLEAEMVRDQALAIAGLLSAKQGGASVYPPQPPGLWRAAFNGQRTWATSEGEDRYRRGLYTFWRRTVPYPSMAAFDAPSRENCTLRRISTNTPLQAFVTLNDPVYVEAAQGLARRIMSQAGVSTEARSAFALQWALCRPAQPAQIEQLVLLYQRELEHYRADADAAKQMATVPLGPAPAASDVAELAAWTVVANVILNLDGVLTKR